MKPNGNCFLKKKNGIQKDIMNNGTNVWSSSYGFKIDYICNYSVFNIGNQGNGTLSNQF